MSRKCAFRSSRELDYAVEVSSVDPNAKEILALRCKFCSFFDREQVQGQKRRKTSTIRFFRKPFRADSCTRHHMTQHPGRWHEHKSLPPKQKEVRFSENRVGKRRRESEENALFFHKSIIDIILNKHLTRDREDWELGKPKKRTVFPPFNWQAPEKEEKIWSIRASLAISCSMEWQWTLWG